MPTPMICHVSELREGDTFRFVGDNAGAQWPRVVKAVRVNGDGTTDVDASSTRPRGCDSRTHCIDDGEDRVMVEILARGGEVVGPA
jgi:hypothetical protein